MKRFISCFSVLLLCKPFVFTSSTNLQQIELNEIPVDALRDERKLTERQSDSSCVCGLGERRRIVGGTQAMQNEYPWMAGIYWSSGDIFCGGAIINSRYILSASHCYPGVSPNEIFVILGDYDRGTVSDAEAKQYSVETIIMHEKFGISSRVDSDIALLRIAVTIEFKLNIRPICLPPPNTNYIGQTGTVAGWGTTSFGGTESNMLLEVEIPILEDAICKANFTKFYTSNMMCGGYLEGGKDACQGDSGGPLFVPDENNVYNMAGVISFGRGCATPGYPGVYTKVINYLDWIEEKTKGTPACTRPSKNPSKCGVANNPSRRKRIIGGTDTPKNKYPWTAVIIVRNSQGAFELRCGATLIDEHWLLTTARCVYGYRASDLSVVLGDHNIAIHENKEIQRFVDSVRIHPNFLPSTTFTHDIALLRMSRAVAFTKEISPICLPFSEWSEESLLNIEGVATGWGQNNKGSTIEQEVYMHIITNRNCSRFFGFIPNHYLCAGGIKGQDICNNDYGGQFSVTDSEGLYRLVGISAFSAKDDCANGRPAGFTRVISFLSWIAEITGLVASDH